MIEINGLKFYPHQSKGLTIATYKYEDYFIYSFVYLTEKGWTYVVRYKAIFGYRDKDIQDRFDMISASSLELARKLNQK